MKKVEEIVGYLYIKNGKIMGSDKTGKNISLGKAFEITLPGYYRMIDGVPKLIVSEKELKKGDIFVGNRDWDEYWEKRKEATGSETKEGTFAHDELKDVENEENVDNVEDE